MLYTNHPREREDKLTYATFEEMRDATWLAWSAIFGEPPTSKQLAIKLAHWAFETGYFSVGMHLFNLNNEKCPDPDKWDHTYFKCGETIDGVRKTFHPPHVQTRFKAFDSLEQGVRRAIEFVAIDTTPNNGRPNRYAKAQDALMSEDVIGYCHELKTAGFYTADRDHYTGNVKAITGKYLKRLDGYEGPPVVVVPPELVPDDGEREHKPISDDDLRITWADLEVPWDAIAEAKKNDYLAMNDYWGDDV